jgi:hypothetical protein
MTISMKNIRLAIALFTLTFLVNSTSSAQCKTEIKEGIKKLSLYTHNGQTNNLIIVAEKPLELHLSFYKGLRYKIQLASDAGLGLVHFKVWDEDKNELFDSSDDKVDFWEFLSTSSQELTIEIISTDKSKKNCVAVLVGMKSNKVASNPMRDL